MGLDRLNLSSQFSQYIKRDPTLLSVVVNFFLSCLGEAVNVFVLLVSLAEDSLTDTQSYLLSGTEGSIFPSCLPTPVSLGKMPMVGYGCFKEF